jgi:hypothetical protein
MAKVDNLIANLGDYFELFFIMADVDISCTNIEGYFKLTFIMQRWVIYM